MTSLDNDARLAQRGFVIVLGDLLEAGLPVGEWMIDNPARPNFEPGLTCWIDSAAGVSPERDAQRVEALTRWSRHLGTEITTTQYGWVVRATVNGVSVNIYASLTKVYLASHTPEQVVSLIGADEAGQYVRRTSPRYRMLDPDAPKVYAEMLQAVEAVTTP